jgi:hypothetical protein
MSTLVTITPGRCGSRGTPLGAFISLVARLCRTKSDTTFPIVCFRAAAIDRAAARTSSSRSNVVLMPNHQASRIRCQRRPQARYLARHRRGTESSRRPCHREARSGAWQPGMMDARPRNRGPLKLVPDAYAVLPKCHIRGTCKEIRYFLYTSRRYVKEDAQFGSHYPPPDAANSGPSDFDRT